MTAFVTPGSNTLRQALSIQGQQAINYYQYSGRSVNAEGNDVSSYLPPVVLRGAVQPIKRTLYQQMGLEFQKNYANLYITRYVQDVSRGTSGDQFSYNGRIWQLESNVNWAAQDGWTGVLCVDVGADPNAYVTAGQYTDPGTTGISSLVIPSVDLSDGKLLIVDVPKWTVGDAYWHPIVFGSALVDGQTIAVNVAINGVQQGALTVTAAGGIATDHPTHFPGLSSYGVVAGGLRAQFNVRLTISSAVVSTADVTLSRGVASP